MAPLAIDLFCGLGGWAEGLMAAGWGVVGFDRERHVYGAHRYPAQLVRQDVLTLHGSQFAGADLIVASPPCQNYSYLAMPWSRSKSNNSQKAKALRRLWETEGPDNRLFDACFRIQREASEAAGKHIPLIVENVRGAQPLVGRSAWCHGSYYLWGDVPALMSITMFNGAAHETRGVKQGGSGAAWFDQALDERRKAATAIKVGGDWFGTYAEMKANGTISPGRIHGKNSTSRKCASALIAKIPFDLAYHIGRVFYPAREVAA